MTRGIFQFPRLKQCLVFFQNKIRKDLRHKSRKNLKYSLTYWKSANNGYYPIIPVTFSKTVRSAFAAQESSARAQMMLSDLPDR